MFMIRGAEQAFKFTTSFDFEDICNIVAVFSQPHNEGTATAPMPITKYYSINDAGSIRNDGFSPVDGDSKSFISMLSAEETMRFSDKYKGCVQATVYCDKVNRTDKSKIEYFTVYPTMTDEVFSNIPSGSGEITHVLDAGEIIAE
jgi:hypothetical protein